MALAALSFARADAQQLHVTVRNASLAKNPRVITWTQFRTAELQWFDDVDRNHDGTIDARDYGLWMHTRFAHTSPTITRRAFEAALRRQFEALDTNHDGILTPSELRAGAPVPRTLDFGVPDGEAF